MANKKFCVVAIDSTIEDSGQEVFAVPSRWINNDVLTYRNSDLPVVWNEAVKNCVTPNKGGHSLWVSCHCEIKESNITGYLTAMARANCWITSLSESENEDINSKRLRHATRRLDYVYSGDSDLNSEVDKMKSKQVKDATANVKKTVLNLVPSTATTASTTPVSHKPSSKLVVPTQLAACNKKLEDRIRNLESEKETLLKNSQELTQQVDILKQAEQQHQEQQQTQQQQPPMQQSSSIFVTDEEGAMVNLSYATMWDEMYSFVACLRQIGFCD